MPLSPRQRRRALRAHQLRNEGLPLRQIADHLDISHSTARRDLLALETDWPDIARAAAHELILQLVQLCRHRLETLAREGPLGPFNHHPARINSLSPDHRIRLHELHNRALRNTAAQLLQAVAQLNADAVAAGPIDPADWSADELPYPLDELTDAQRPAPDNPYQDVPNPTTPNHFQPPRPDRDPAQSGQEDRSPFDAFLDRLCGPNPPELRSAHALAALNGTPPRPAPRPAVTRARCRLAPPSQRLRPSVTLLDRGEAGSPPAMGERLGRRWRR